LENYNINTKKLLQPLNDLPREKCTTIPL